MLTFSTSCKLALLSTPRIFCASSSVIPLAFAAALTLSGVTPDFCASARGTHTDAHCPGRPELHSLARHAGGQAAGRTNERLPIRLGAGTQQHARARHYQVCQDAGGLRADTRPREGTARQHRSLRQHLYRCRQGCRQHEHTMYGCTGAAGPAPHLSPPCLKAPTHRYKAVTFAIQTLLALPVYTQDKAAILGSQRSSLWQGRYPARVSLVQSH